MKTGDTSTSFRKRFEGQYANCLSVGHNAFEFVLDFSQEFSENEEAEQYMRIVTSPVHAKAMMATLQAAIEAYESAYGPVIKR